MSQEPIQSMNDSIEQESPKTDQSSKGSFGGCFVLSLLPAIFIADIILAFCGYGLAGALGFTYWFPGKYWDATIVVDSVAPLPDYGLLDKSGLLEEYWDWGNVMTDSRTIHAQFLRSEIDTKHIAILTIDRRYSSFSDSAYVPPVVKGDTLYVRLNYNDVGWIPFNTMTRSKFGFHVQEIKNAKQIYEKHGRLAQMGVLDEMNSYGWLWTIVIVIVGLYILLSIAVKILKKVLAKLESVKNK